mmetsp:Transcript_36712/g.91411  ORF Transcript_36712/g.91411 Transcript_36712/m.91411 type:complete len:127 (-) Transcript_36712:70-450(-)|eukprot:CAMPEP_0205877960 /NCGR_PEP_ID=MMETSP1083-20121108/14599_1 /ASSEMBLY_ACC=CAM_ASM_000430 /TAXON_ID=97485 /ORGANISM="Prymnesium parvum, Strain Texoma1" /LENGTH=126 /DNA_ID=CAMNT_0053240801 /DNA_START=35 /DNA_END=412 /DNA_ORIENTATION=+
MTNNVLKRAAPRRECTRDGSRHSNTPPLPLSPRRRTDLHPPLPVATRGLLLHSLELHQSTYTRLASSSERFLLLLLLIAAPPPPDRSSCSSSIAPQLLRIVAPPSRSLRASLRGLLRGLLRLALEA